jgi:UDP-N-acetylmuramoyl-L-alanyl-D-glutamate--2,6-diaminopimelate ligase
LKIPVKHPDFNYICDDSSLCDIHTAFILTAQNRVYKTDALERGAKAVLSPIQCHKILGINPELKVIGITGTNGKTTTAAAIYSIFLDLHVSAALQGTRGCFVNDACIESRSLTTPPILQTLAHMAQASKAGCRYFVMEVSSHAIAQERIESLGFALKIFTNLSQDHLDFHGTMEAYRNTKSKFFMDDSAKLINGDQKTITYNRKNSFTYGIEHPADFGVKTYALSDGIDALFWLKGKECWVDSPLQGHFNVYNLLAATAAVWLLENPLAKDLEEAISGFAGVSGRMEVVNQDPRVIVDFAHTPDGMEQVLKSLKSHELVVVFGAGGNRDVSKRPLMGKIASRYAKKVIVTSDNPRFEDPNEIITQICSGIPATPTIISNRKEAINYALSSLGPKETLVILGKGDEDYQEINGVKHPFDDRKIVRQWFEANK